MQVTVVPYCLKKNGKKINLELFSTIATFFTSWIHVCVQNLWIQKANCPIKTSLSSPYYLEHSRGSWWAWIFLGAKGWSSSRCKVLQTHEPEPMERITLRLQLLSFKGWTLYHCGGCKHQPSKAMKKGTNNLEHVEVIWVMISKYITFLYTVHY